MWKLNDINPKTREKLYMARGMLKKGKRENIAQIYELAESDSKEWYANKGDASIWKHAFTKLMISTDKRGAKLAKEFYTSPVEIIRENQIPRLQSIVMICVAKNELSNMKLIYQYYKSVGVCSFAYIDNNSVDDSVRYFMDCSDVNVYSAPMIYTSIKRQAWINRVIAHYGFDKWYIVVDSDEYLTYNDSETKSICDVIKFCEDKKIDRMRALMVDMYPKQIYFNNQIETDFLGRYTYFDKDTYCEKTGRRSLLFRSIQGGVRARIFAKNANDDRPELTKYPLICIRKGDIQFLSHMSFPFYKNFASENYLALRHYKFMPTDFEKYEERVKKGNFANGSQEYIQYVKEMSKGYITFYDEKHSVEYTNTCSLYQIPELCMIPWEE